MYRPIRRMVPAKKKKKKEKKRFSREGGHLGTLFCVCVLWNPPNKQRFRGWESIEQPEKGNQVFPTI